MRKQQQKILEKAKKHNFTQEQIAVLTREDLTIQELHIVYNYFYRQPGDIPYTMSEL